MVRIINPWNTRQIARMEELIKEAKLLNRRVAWREHVHELGHSLHAINTMASTIYKRLRADEMRAERRFLRQIADSFEDEKQTAAEKNMAREREVTGMVATSFPRPKAMATLIAQAEIRSRISVLGITGGMLGDPLPGRSALDRKRAGLAEEQKPNRHKEDVAASSMFWRLKWKIERGEIPAK